MRSVLGDGPLIVCLVADFRFGCIDCGDKLHSCLSASPHSSSPTSLRNRHCADRLMACQSPEYTTFGLEFKRSQPRVPCAVSVLTGASTLTLNSLGRFVPSPDKMLPRHKPYNPRKIPCPWSACTRTFRNSSGLTKHCNTIHRRPSLSGSSTSSSDDSSTSSESGDDNGSRGSSNGPPDAEEGRSFVPHPHINGECLCDVEPYHL